jgi:hypothetical protein
MQFVDKLRDSPSLNQLDPVEENRVIQGKPLNLSLARLNSCQEEVLALFSKSNFCCTHKKGEKR